MAGSLCGRRITKGSRLVQIGKIRNPLKDAKTRMSSVSGCIPDAKRKFSVIRSSCRPYAELMRLDKPTGALYLFWPCLFSTLLAASLPSPMAPPVEVLSLSSHFLIGAVVMRGAGCTINDFWDRSLDSHVERTKMRPLARKAVTPVRALTFAGAQVAFGLAVLLQLPPQCLWYGIPTLPLVIIYPLMKRVTNYPQVVLGVSFSWGALMGFPALGIDLLTSQDVFNIGACLYGSCVLWTIFYDMIYAYMDVKDDAKAGIKSIARAHSNHPKALLTLISVAQVGLLACAGVAANAGPFFFVGSCGCSLVSLIVMVRNVQLKDPASCNKWFVKGCWLVGGSVSLGMLLDYLVKYSNQHEGYEGVASYRTTERDFASTAYNEWSDWLA